MKNISKLSVPQKVAWNYYERLEKEMFLPGKISKLVKDEPYKTDDTGMSGASILIYKDKVLKVQDYNEEARNEYDMLKYLQGRLPVPKVYTCEISDGKLYIFNGKIQGVMACSQVYMDNPDILCELLVSGLQKLWSIDIKDCPSCQGLSKKLKDAAYNVENGLVDLDNTEPGTFSEDGFKNPAALLQWLYENKPEEEPVLSHGDYCPQNIFGTGNEVTGYIDLGKTGISDKWCDIALCYRSLLHNYNEKYKQHKNNTDEDYNRLFLFNKLGIKPDWNKIQYYILLDELF